MNIDPNVELFAEEALPPGTSKARINSLARDIQRAINTWWEEEHERLEELRSLQGFDPTEVAEKF